jgi:hypothetical protein
MSQKRTLKTRMRDPVALGVTCRRLGLPISGRAAHRVVLLGKTSARVDIDTSTGLASWQAVTTTNEEIVNALGRLARAYACERAGSEARRRGRRITEQITKLGPTLIQIVPRRSGTRDTAKKQSNPRLGMHSA